MKNLNLKIVSELLSDKLGKELKITQFKPAGSGYHSDGFVLYADNGEKFFIKKFKSNDLGFEIPERKINSLLISNGMSKRIDSHPEGIGVLVKNKNSKEFLPEVNAETEIFHIQKFLPEYKDTSICYLDVLKEKIDKKALDDFDLNELEKITDTISEIHLQKHPSKDEQYLKDVYNDGLRNLLTNPELAIMLLQYFKDDDELLPRKMHSEYIGLMLNNIYKWENRHDRLSALHGDFWGSNLFINNNNIDLVDFSRIPWGDPGIDIGWWIAQYVWNYYQTQNQIFIELLEKFLDLYINKTGDKEIRSAVAPTFGLMGIIYVNPRFYPNRGNDDISKQFMAHVWRILKEEKFIW